MAELLSGGLDWIWYVPTDQDRYRTIASLCRQAAAFRPTQKWTLLEQAFEWERLAMRELEAHFANADGGSRWEWAAAA
jgi:hypothetical protein